VTVLDGEAPKERGLTALADIRDVVPAIRQNESATTEIYIRGIGSTPDLPGIESPNAQRANAVISE
jgi:hypothetical protein